MDISRSSTPDAPPQDLWSSILDSVSSSRSIPSKNILVLGQPSTGKSTLTSSLLQKPHTLARLSVYTVPSSSQSYTALLPHFLPPRTSLPHTLVMIVLDWTRPWTFVEELEKWLKWVEKWSKGDGSRELEVIREECRERLQSHLQHYTEPTSDPIPATNSTLSNTILPLGPGTSPTTMLADLIDEGHDMAAGASGMGSMVKGKGGEWEEQIDGVMQVLRAICLKYGASLFYVTPLPSTLQVLRQHVLHLLFAPPAPSIGMPSEAPAPVRNPFPFPYKPNALDRDHVVIPAGWDSWGKIGVLREGFDAKMWGEAWEKDLDSEQADEAGAQKLYASLVPDQGAKPPPLPPFNSPTPEQAFLAKNYDENAKKTDRDPRGAFRNPADLAGAAAGIVGPLGSSSFSLPTVERAMMEMETGGNANTGGAAADPSRRLPGRTGGAGGRPPGLSALGTSVNAATGRPPGSPGPAASPSPTSGQTQHEVLQNFFQSLLSSKDRPGGNAGGASRGSGGRANGNTGGSGVEEGGG
ncbi:hypothetical protein BDQ17DRAFT_1389437 [Cyathus striatus]|nr:hypothetical protein BDQ17DRAFT_1389437 [Cyathus striatus]